MQIVTFFIIAHIRTALCDSTLKIIIAHLDTKQEWLHVYNSTEYKNVFAPWGPGNLMFSLGAANHDIALGNYFSLIQPTEN